MLRSFQEPELSQHFPEVEMLINILDEPRVLRGNGGGSASDRDGTVLLDWTDPSHEQVWSETTATCDRDSSFGASRSPPFIRGYATTGPAFYTDKSDEVDLCRHPEDSTVHGIWRSPTNLDRKLACAHTITRSTIHQGRHTVSGRGVFLQRLLMTSPRTCTGTPRPRDSTGLDQRPEAFNKQAIKNGSKIIDNDWSMWPTTSTISPMCTSGVGEAGWYRKGATQARSSGPFTTFILLCIVQCADPTTEKTVRAYFDVHEIEPRREAFRYTFTFDLDGNGHSKRFCGLLNSRSLPLKQTVFREWHEERLQLWQQYVPISLSTEDLLEVVRCLVSERKGQQMAAQMAEKGREWSLRALRPIDQAVYLFHLMIELSRLQNPSRWPSQRSTRGWDEEIVSRPRQP